MLVETFALDGIQIALGKEGARAYSKVSYPLRYGRFAEIKTPEHVFQFNLNGELKFISGRGRNWPNPSEWLKRTITDDWVYYSTGGYEGVFDCLGEYYVPCLSYPTNNFSACDPFHDNAVLSAIQAWELLPERLTGLKGGSLPTELGEFLEVVISNSPGELHKKSRRIREILGDDITVLPPDARHVDYDVIPLLIADGCLYRCRFCRVKSRFHFKERSREDIRRQVKELKDFFGRDISNYNSLFLGQHDALNASAELVEFAARYAYDAFELGSSHLEGPCLFLFGSVDSVIKSDDSVFERINRLPFRTYINVGLESSDAKTLHQLGKGIATEAVERAFGRILEINNRYEKVEMTSNFVFGDNLPEGHMQSFFNLMEKNFSHPFYKGTIYFSPLMDIKNGGWKKNIKREFFKLKVRIPVPSFLYLIQRL